LLQFTLKLSLIVTVYTKTLTNCYSLH